jgi:hypothetical protein
MKTVLLLYVTIGLLQSCTLLPCNSDAGLSRAPDTVRPEDLIGIYKPDEFSLTQYPALRFSGAWMEIQPGWLEFKNVPLGVFSLDSFYETSNRLVSGTASWGIKPYGSNIFSVSIGFDDAHLQGFSTGYPLYRKDKKHVILIRVGDPDECRALRFVQQ